MMRFQQLIKHCIDTDTAIFGCDLLSYADGYGVISAFAHDVTSIVHSGDNPDPDKDQYLYRLSTESIPLLPNNILIFSSIVFEVELDKFDLLRNELSTIARMITENLGVFEFRVLNPTIFKHYVRCLSPDRTQRLLAIPAAIHVPIAGHGLYTFRKSAYFSSFRKFDKEVGK